MCHTSRGVCGVLISIRPWAHRWINDWSLCDKWPVRCLLCPSQPQGMTTPWPIPNYTACWHRHKCANNLPKVVTWKRNDRRKMLSWLSVWGEAQMICTWFIHADVWYMYVHDTAVTVSSRFIKITMVFVFGAGLLWSSCLLKQWKQCAWK